jgi:tape measure domain-containing protein
MAGTSIRNLFVEIGLEFDDKALTDFDKRLASTKSNVKTLAKFVTAGAVSIGVFLNEAGKFEQTSIAFETMLGSAEEAQALLQEMADFAAKTPFTLPGVESAAKQLLAVGIESDKMIGTLKALGDVSAGLSVPLSRLALNFGQVKTQGKLTGRELRDFAIAGVPLADELAKQLNVSKAEVADLVSAGKIGFPEVEKAFISMTSEGGRFFDLMDKQSKSFFGIMSNILDVLILQAREIGKGLLPQAKALAKEFLAFLELNRDLIKTRAVKFFKEVGKAIILTVKAVGAILSAVFDITEAFGGLEKVVKLLIGAYLAMIALNLVSLLGSAAFVVFKLVKAFKALGFAATLANAQVLAIPLAIGLAIIALGLIFEDLFSFLTGKESVIGLILNKITEALDKIIDAFENRFPNAFKVVTGLFKLLKLQIQFILLPITLLSKLVKGIVKGIQVIKGSKFADILPDTDMLSNVGENIGGIFGASPATSPAGASTNNRTNVTTITSNPKIEVNVTESGATGEQIAEAVDSKIKESNNAMLLNAQQDTKPTEEF